MTISAAIPYEKHYQTVLGYQMAYIEAGEGDPIVFLHGNPASSFVWRNIIPHLQGLGRCLAPDLIGMGDSDKLHNSGPGSYGFFEHRSYVERLLDALEVRERVTFVLHDWGAALGFDWANRHRQAVKGLVYMEPVVRPYSWATWPEATRDLWKAFRSNAGERLVLEDNVFLEHLLPRVVLRELSEEERAEYRRPFAQSGEGRRPMLSWPRQAPIDDERADMFELITAYGEWLARSDVPKLYINNDPGTATQTAREFCRSFRAQAEVTVKGSHYLQEDSPGEIGTAIATWLQTLV
ncbi:haloalkane dehalogenase [Dictyobacter arantiisoli]|uniref:Haloalkane dehalogenase 3 n=1 Tax=Dictyobacter arantiisoli TaxID=2014874 RepID=A0A5A5TAI3_9CHLR|nr:haloalkane dehalogenase [Dictyobacter arantiisoli]GCF08520.1 haloalkane dehalogenase 3 [Dictyobacter arantiisoli]